jgi:DNA-binding NtrC family response regulator
VVVLAGAEHHPRADGRAGRVRDDLFAVLSAIEFTLPPLRQRREDIAGLAAVFAHEAAARAGRRVLAFTSEAEGLLHEARWPGNVAELRAAIDRACLLAEGDVIGVREVSAALPPGAVPAAAVEDEDDLPLSSVEREHILRALQRAGGNKKVAARVLGVSRRALYRKLERLDLGATISRRPRARAATAARRQAAAAPPSLG